MDKALTVTAAGLAALLLAAVAASCSPAYQEGFVGAAIRHGSGRGAGVPGGRGPRGRGAGVPGGRPGGRPYRDNLAAKQLAKERSELIYSFGRFRDSEKRKSGELLRRNAKRTNVFRLSEKNFEVQTPEYMRRALSASTMAWFVAYLGASKANLEARGVGTIEEYAERYANAFVPSGQVPPKLLAKLRNASGMAKDAIERAVDSKRAPEEMRNLIAPPVWPWRIAVTGSAASHAEGGLPHTMHDAIVIPQSRIKKASARELAGLLVHEATHVYQRMRPKEARMVLERDFGFVREFEMAARKKINRFFHLHRLYRLEPPGGDFAFKPIDAGSLHLDWRDASQAHAEGALGAGEAAEFHKEHVIWEYFGSGPDGGPGGDIRANPDTDDERWVKAAGGPGGGAAGAGGPGRGWPGGVLFCPRPYFSEGGDFSRVELRDGDGGVLGMPGEHPMEVMAYAWQEAASAGG